MAKGRRINWRLILAAFKLKEAIDNARQKGVSKERLLLAEDMLKGILERNPYIKLSEDDHV